MRKEGGKGGGRGVKIVPRVLVEGWTLTDFKEVFVSDATMGKVARFLVKNLQVMLIHG